MLIVMTNKIVILNTRVFSSSLKFGALCPEFNRRINANDNNLDKFN